MTKEVRIEVPFAQEFSDYHEIDHLADDINDVAHAQPSLKCTEVAFCGSYYIGVFYVGRLPSRKRLKEIVKKSLEIDDKEYEIDWAWKN